MEKLPGTEYEEGKLTTVPFDPRFPNANQTKHCFTSYVNFYRCEALLGEGEEKCQYFKRAFEILCPNGWVSHWDEQRENGTFPAHIVRSKTEK